MTMNGVSQLMRKIKKNKNIKNEDKNGEEELKWRERESARPGCAGRIIAGFILALDRSPLPLKTY